MPAMKNLLKPLFRKAANALGYDVVRYDHANPRYRLARLLARRGITLLLDVGANAGQYGKEMRELGFSGRIVSFEPLADAFAALTRGAQGDAGWETVNIGLGDRDESRVIHVAANSQSSSFLPMLAAHNEAAPESAYAREQPAQIRRLDGVFGAYCRPSDRVFLKIDTQGFEKNVLDGAQGILQAVDLVQVECSFVPLYGQALLMEDMIAYVRQMGFDPIETMPAFYHRDSGHLMQADILFARR
jgi:FkbM family methyltransferase